MLSGNFTGSGGTSLGNPTKGDMTVDRTLIFIGLVLAWFLVTVVVANAARISDSLLSGTATCFRWLSRKERPHGVLNQPVERIEHTSLTTLKERLPDYLSDDLLSGHCTPGTAKAGFSVCRKPLLAAFASGCS
jgi:hypothetical protein